MLGLNGEVTRSTQWCSDKKIRTPFTREWMRAVTLQGVGSHGIYYTESRALQWRNHYWYGSTWVEGAEVQYQKELRGQRQQPPLLSWRQGGTYYGMKQHCWSVTANIGVGRAHWWGKQGLVPVGVGAVGRGLGIRNELKR